MTRLKVMMGKCAPELFQLTRLKRQNIPRLALQHFRDALKAKKADGGKKPEASMGVGVDACRKTELPPGKIPATTFLQLDRESGYLPLLVDYDLRQEVDGKELAALIPPCQPSGDKT